MFEENKVLSRFVPGQTFYLGNNFGAEFGKIGSVISAKIWPQYSCEHVKDLMDRLEG